MKPRAHRQNAPEKPASMDAMLRLDAQFCFPLYAATNLITRAYGPLLKPLGLTYPQYLVMLVLWEQPKITVKDLGARLLLDSGTLSPLLARLEAARLVKKGSDPEDGRRVIISLTARGEALRGPAREVPAALACRLLLRTGGVPMEQLHSLQTQLRSLVFDQLAADRSEDLDTTRPAHAPPKRQRTAT